MKLERLLTLILLILFMSGCASVKVQTDFDPAYNFSSYKTYRWATEAELKPDDVLSQNPLLRNRIANSVDSVMAGKGFTKMDSGDADLVIVMHAGTKEKIRVDQTSTSMSRGPGYGWYAPWWGAYGGSTTVSQYTEGTLVIDMVPWETKDLAWRGMGTKTIKNYKDNEKRQKAINKAVALILADFPPK